MKIANQSEAIHKLKPGGAEVWYYLFPEYEIHYNEQSPHTTQPWHYHKQIHESLFIFEGELIAHWEESGVKKSQVLHAGDLVETGNYNHTFENASDNVVKFIALKQMHSGKDKSQIFASDKFMDK
jgi:uncharacterized cupin superfamily protein